MISDYCLLIIVVIVSALCQKLCGNLIIYACTIIGAFLIFLSATPLALLFYVIWIVVIISWLPVVSLRISLPLKVAGFLRIIAVCLPIIALIVELPFHLEPSNLEGKFEKLYIIGDSVSAGIGGKTEQTWPKILEKKYGINIVDLSEPGATVGSAMRQAAQVDSADAVVLLEIGGNDLFAPTTPDTFAENLTQILKTVSTPKRMVVMLELPLKPWHIKYGRIQRQLAKRFDVILIPKRFLVSVFAAKDATVDLAHLSPSGHKLMSEKIWSLVGNLLFQTPEPPQVE